MISNTTDTPKVMNLKSMAARTLAWKARLKPPLPAPAAGLRLPTLDWIQAKTQDKGELGYQTAPLR